MRTKGGRAVIKRTQIRIATIISIVSWWDWEMLCWFCFLLLGLRTTDPEKDAWAERGLFSFTIPGCTLSLRRCQRQELETVSYMCAQSGAGRRHACLHISAPFFVLFIRIVRPQPLGTLTTYRLGCLTSVNMVKIISCKHAHRPVWPRQSLTEPLFPGDSRFCQVDH